MADDNSDIIEVENTESNEQTFNHLETVKALLGLSNDDSTDSLLSVYVEMTKQSILNFCNISELPSELNYTLCAMVADTYRELKSANTTGEVVGNVSSISEDGRSVSFSSGQEYKRSVEDKISRTTELIRFKKLYRLD